MMWLATEIRLTTLYEFHCQRLNADKERAIVTDVISRIIQQPITIQCYLAWSRATSDVQRCGAGSGDLECGATSSDRRRLVRAEFDR